MNSPAPALPASSGHGATRRFSHVAIVGKYNAPGSRDAVEAIAQFLHAEGCDVSLETETALNTGLMHHPALSVASIGQHCELALVVGGDGTMLGVARQLARFNVPLVGVNQGRLGFITDIRFDAFAEILRPMLHGLFTEERRALMAAKVMRDGR